MNLLLKIILTGVAIWLVICVVMVTVALWRAGGLRAWRCVMAGQCDSMWLWNEREMLQTSYGRLAPQYRWVGVYRCRHCGDTSYGAAKHEQATREVKGEPADWGTA